MRKDRFFIVETAEAIARGSEIPPQWRSAKLLLVDKHHPLAEALPAVGKQVGVVIMAGFEELPAAAFVCSSLNLLEAMHFQDDQQPGQGKAH